MEYIAEIVCTICKFDIQQYTVIFSYCEVFQQKNSWLMITEIQ